MPSTENVPPETSRQLNQRDFLLKCLLTSSILGRKTTWRREVPNCLTAVLHEKRRWAVPAQAQSWRELCPGTQCLRGHSCWYSHWQLASPWERNYPILVIKNIILISPHYSRWTRGANALWKDRHSLRNLFPQVQYIQSYSFNIRSISLKSKFSAFAPISLSCSCLKSSGGLLNGKNAAPLRPNCFQAPWCDGASVAQIVSTPHLPKEGHRESPEKE